jgi:membrane protease YdiL (CAAX protease family)
LNRTITYTIPALALIWYFLFERNNITGKNPLKPAVNDIYSFLLGFPALAVTGLVLSFAMTVFPAPKPPRMEAPGNLTGWLIMIVSCIGTGYLEESFFRYYLLRKMKLWASSSGIRVLFSVVLFAVCHIYEGPWGILNSVLAGFLLAVLFERYKTLNGIALAHGAYNVFVYVMADFI